jgi:hypothetical protein
MMRNFFEFLIWRLNSPGISVWGLAEYEELPNGKHIIVRDIRMGDSFETEFDLCDGTIVRIRDGRVRVFRDILEQGP